MQEKIYELSLGILQNEKYFDQLVHNTKVNYYWSRDWSEDFYIKQAQLGFISTTYDTMDEIVLLPELQFEYALLDFKDLHINSKVKKLLKEDNFELCFDTKFDEILEKISKHHKDNWLKGPYLTLMQNLYKNKETYPNFRIHSSELFSKKDHNLVAGEIGYIIGSTYTSLTGFSLREKGYNNCGKLQLVLLAKKLEQRGFSFWNLGHPHMEYKKRLGAKIYSRAKFLQRWQEATHQIQKDLYE